MANSAMVLGIENMDNIEGEPNLSAAYFKIVLRNETSIQVGLTVGVIVDWTLSSQALISSIEDQLKQEAAGYGYPLENNSLFIYSFVKK